ncbi:prenyltransferase/squalene oxidase repeat-containing protein [Nonomuraea ferruginea]
MSWLAGLQRPDGSWDDRWHASPYYATLGCALALGEFGGPEHTGAVLRAREWVLASQRDDGSWGAVGRRAGGDRLRRADLAAVRTGAGRAVQAGSRARIRLSSPGGRFTAFHTIVA